MRSLEIGEPVIRISAPGLGKLCTDALLLSTGFSGGVSRIHDRMSKGRRKVRVEGGGNDTAVWVERRNPDDRRWHMSIMAGADLERLLGLILEPGNKIVPVCIYVSASHACGSGVSIPLPFFKPPKAILVPGMYFLGFSRYSN
jgi:hypothetical protein